MASPGIPTNSSRTKIKNYLLNKNLLGSKVKIKKLSFLGGGNHHNYKVSTDLENFVLRISNPQGFGVNALFGVSDEFVLLRLLKKKTSVPRCFF